MDRDKKKEAILAAIKGEKAISVTSIQKRFDIGFPAAFEIYDEEMRRRNGEKGKALGLAESR